MLTCSPENANKYRDWLANRGGILVWSSASMSNLGASWVTPALTDGHPTPKPTWEASDSPKLITEASEVSVSREALFKAFPVALRRSGNGLSLKLTDGAMRRLNKTLTACEAKHGSAFYRKGVLDIDGASIGVFYETEAKPLCDI